MGKINVFMLKIHNSTIVINNLTDVLETIKCELENMSKEDKLKFDVELCEMVQKEYESMPEFDGF